MPVARAQKCDPAAMRLAWPATLVFLSPLSQRSATMMKTFALALVLVPFGLIADSASACCRHRGCGGCGGCYTNNCSGCNGGAPAAAPAPMPAPAQAPAPSAQLPNAARRAYSYQPGVANPIGPMNTNYRGYPAGVPDAGW